MERKETAEKAFTFVWKIENLWCILTRPIHSPKFIVEALNKTEWHLELRPGVYYSDEHLACLLRRDDSNKPESVDVNFEISLVPADGKPPENGKVSRFSFAKDDFYSCDEMALRLSLFRDSFATFTIRCCIWSSDEEFAEAVQCCARTKLAKKKELEFTWATEGISSLSVDPCRSVSLGEDGPLVTLRMHLKDGLYRVKGFRVDVSRMDSRRLLLLTCEVLALDAEGTVVHREGCTFSIMSGCSERTMHIPFYIEKKNLKVFCGPNLSKDVLTLFWKWRTYFIQANELVKTF